MVQRFWAQLSDVLTFGTFLASVERSICKIENARNLDRVMVELTKVSVTSCLGLVPSFQERMGKRSCVAFGSKGCRTLPYRLSLIFHVCKFLWRRHVSVVLGSVVWELRQLPSVGYCYIEGRYRKLDSQRPLLKAPKVAFAFVRPRLCQDTMMGDDQVVLQGALDTLGEVMLGKLASVIGPRRQQGRLEDGASETSRDLDKKVVDLRRRDLAEENEEEAIVGSESESLHKLRCGTLYNYLRQAIATSKEDEVTIEQADEEKEPVHGDTVDDSNGGSEDDEDEEDAIKKTFLRCINCLSKGEVQHFCVNVTKMTETYDHLHTKNVEIKLLSSSKAQYTSTSSALTAVPLSFGISMLRCRLLQHNNILLSDSLVCLSHLARSSKDDVCVFTRLPESTLSTPSANTSSMLKDSFDGACRSKGGSLDSVPITP
ncbi:hypothetical protein L3X38_003751 [Prunus dulcis]|uniref:Uncharacterized protein n=1 Tax=Prunus dulcis TaxID=3755 RepID=A0AAD4ZMM1_PRUDU|nr:hypothetical protein L3X38_003751 [Prunus dulcis]